ncbi:MAG: SAM-dependent methyltransferase [Clostridia bacterium]|nr:SAM-dependent methyltransferase [Clostridia bacterium]
MNDKNIASLCLLEKSKNPLEILLNLVNSLDCPVHNPVHHVLVGSALLTAYKNAGGDIDLEKALEELKKRAEQVPGGACGYWGACGAGISSGMFVSIVTGSNPLKNEEWKLSNLMTAKSLGAIGEVGGPRCCKRNSYIAIAQAVKFAKENLSVEMELQKIKCTHYTQNSQCIGARCPFR